MRESALGLREARPTTGFERRRALTMVLPRARAPFMSAALRFSLVGILFLSGCATSPPEPQPTASASAPQPTDTPSTCPASAPPRCPAHARSTAPATPTPTGTATPSATAAPWGSPGQTPTIGGTVDA